VIKTLIVDDSPLVRALIRGFLESDGGFVVIGEANNGLEGVQQAQVLNPDLVTMDIEMPVMGGLEAIGEIKKTTSVPIVVISTHDTAKLAYEATVKGALEFFTKDMFTTSMSDIQRVHILDTLKHISGIKGRAVLPRDPARQNVISPRRINAVVIASSTGGPRALSQLCAALPGDFPVPVMVVQHNTSGFDRGFAQWLDGYGPLEVCIAEEGVLPVPGKIYVAPTDRHLILGRVGFLYNNGEPVNNQKPSADILFKSAAALYKSSLVSVVLTGMGNDGAEGTRLVKQAGGITIAQDEGSSMIYGMPRAAADTGAVDLVLPLGAIPERLVALTKGCAGK
jgi:two-component system chemotaxis response regulator CheB